LLKHFSENEVKILEQSEYVNGDEYLRAINGMVESIKNAENEPLDNGISIEKLD